MSTRRKAFRCGGIAVLAGALLVLTACSVQEAPEEPDGYVPPAPQGPPPAQDSKGSVPELFKGLYCPEPGSREDKNPQRTIVAKGNETERIYASGGGASVHIPAGTTVTADVVVCGGAATLIIEGELRGRAWLQGGGPRLILVDKAGRPAVWFHGGGPEEIRCYDKLPIPPEGGVACSRYF